MVQDSYSGRCVRSDSTRADGAGRDVRCNCYAAEQFCAVPTSVAATNEQPRALNIPRRKGSHTSVGALDHIQALGQGILLGICTLCAFALFFTFVVGGWPSDPTARYALQFVCVVVALLEYRSNLRKFAARRR